MTHCTAVTYTSSHIDIIIVSGKSISHPQFHSTFLYIRCIFPFTFVDSAREERASITCAPFLSIQAIYYWKNYNVEKCPERNFQRFQRDGPYWSCNWERSSFLLLYLYLFFFLRLKNIVGIFSTGEISELLQSSV